MQRMIVCTSHLVALLVLLLPTSRVSAETVVIDYTFRGWYSQLGEHNSSNLNYIAGDLRGPGCDACLDDYRNFFIFDLAGIDQPIQSATLALFVPGPPLPGYSSPYGKEAYELHDVVTSLTKLRAGTGGVEAWTDLGSGVVYGVRSMTAADSGSVIEITLNSSAIAALNATTGRIGIGGSITTLDGLPNNQYVFGYTNSDTGTELTQLRLTLVPEPSCIALAIFAVMIFSVSRSRAGYSAK